MEITLIRHGKPRLPSLNRLTASAFSDWVREYDASGLCSSSKPAAHVVRRAQACHAVVCSDLPRSVESADALGLNGNILSSALFNEAGLPVADWRGLKLSPKLWAVMFRVFWLFGYARGSESFAEAKTRAAEAGEALVALAREHGSVLFVGHGVYNRILANQLRKSGWSGPKSPNSEHWGMTVYEYQST